MKKEQLNWNKVYKKGKAPLSWNIDDYKVWDTDPPDCVLKGYTEGELLEPDDIEKWFLDCLRALQVLSDEYPEKFEEQYHLYLLDLEYLLSLGKISEEMKKKMASKENINFG